MNYAYFTDTMVPKNNQFIIGFNTTLSNNRISQFDEIMIDYLDGEAVSTVYKNSQIAMSPNTISNGMIQWNYDMNKNIRGHLQVRTKYVGRQYLDNTENESRSLDPYQTIDFQWLISSRFGDLRLDIMNLSNTNYAPNGYTWGYLYGGERTDENFVFPMAGRNFFITYSIKLDGKKENI